MTTQPIPMDYPKNKVLGEARPNEAIRSRKGKINNLAVILTTTAVVLALVIGGFSYYYAQASSTISSLQSNLYSANSQISAQNTQISSLGNDITNYQSQIASLQGQLNTTNAQISSLGNDIADYQSQIASLQNQLSLKTSELASLQDRVDYLQNIVDLSYWSTIATVTINQLASQSSLVTYFQPEYAGYITVSGTTNTTNGFIKVTNSHATYPYTTQTYSFGTGTTLTIPVLPGTVAVYFGNTNTSDSAIANITVVYHY